MSAFTFSFGGDDIEEDALASVSPSPILPSHAAETGTLRPSHGAGVFPVSGQALLPAQTHILSTILHTLPERISYSTLRIELDDGEVFRIPRRELWDVRVQLMHEDEEVGLGDDDVKTGVYEGGFKSWESSVDLVRVLADRRGRGAGRIVELGCGTALPSLAVLQWHLQNPWSGQTKNALELAVADYNPSVLRLVTVPNLLLSWAQCRQSDWQDEGEMEIDEEVLTAFTSDLAASNIGIELFSGAWGEEFVRLVKAKMGDGEVEGPLTVIGTETIYSPFALQSFAEVLSRILGPKDGEGGEKETGKRKEKEKERDAVALVGAKMVYFGVGGSVEDFCEEVKRRGGSTEQIREETEGVRRTVMEVRWG